MGEVFLYRCRGVVGCILLAGLLLASPAVSWAADTVCARVKIEIKQELTLERQAFDAHMRINNGLANISLDNVRVDVSFADEDGNPVSASSDPADTDALFYIRIDSMDNIDDVSGTGTVEASTSADIHWLIIPAPGASNGLESGTLYYVGAKLIYDIGGEQKVTEVTPDYIFVKPMPEVTLDYFLPADVYGDDPLTEGTVEPIEPFTLGVRVKNNGHGVARQLKIESAQPQIKENEQGLLIGFAIEGSEVNGQAAGDSLLVDFGDIAPASAGVARWIMTCTLSGKFVSFTADYSHSDELGGELTSLIQEVNTHFLVRDVLVDLPGRDAVRDFLAHNGSVYRIYESEVTGLADPESGDPEVNNQSQSAVLTGTGDTRTLQTAVTAGFMYVRLDDPFNGQKVLKEVVRSDGKIIKPQNAWLSHTRVRDNPWQYHLNLFDVNSPGTYTIRFEDASAVPVPPAMQYITDKTVAEGEQVSFIVEASDPNGTVPQLSAAPLPTGAGFIDQGQGLGTFDWTPAAGQAGIYGIVFAASDGALEISRRITITVTGFRDSDGDGMDDEWELQQFGTLARDGSGDFDRDGISDLDEFLNDTDPAALADLAIRQAVDHISPSVGDELVLTLTATNKGSREATGVEVVNLLSRGLNYNSDDSGGAYDPVSGIWFVGNLSDLEPGNTATLNLTVEVMRPGKILNIAALTNADLFDPDPSNNSTALLLNGPTQTDLALVQTVDNLTPEAGDTIMVALAVTNNGVDDATGVRIEELLPGGLSFEGSTATQGDYDPATGIWTLGELASGAGAELQLALAVDNIDEIILSAVISGSDQSDPDPTNNRTSIVINQDPSIHPYIADLAIHKRVNQPEVEVGEQTVFTLLVRNNGPDDAGNIEIDDLLPDGLALHSAGPSQGTYDDQSELWQLEILPAGAAAVMEMTVDVVGAGEQDNTAGIASLDEFDPDGGNNTDAASVTGLAADIAVIGSVDQSTANVGEDFIFTFEVTNQGPHDAIDIQVVNEVPSGLVCQSDGASQGGFDPGIGGIGLWDIGALAHGSVATLQIICRVETAGEMIHKTTLQFSSPTDIDSTNDAARVTVTGYAPPVVSDIPGQTIDEGELFLTIDLDDYVEDADNADAELDWTYNGDSEFSVEIDDGTHVAAIIIPHPDWYGSETITFKATDPLGLSDESTVLFIVAAVNDDPSAAIDQTFSGSEGQSIAFAGSATDVDSTDLTFFWDFDYRGEFVADTHGSDLSTPTWTYADDGTYTAALRVEDASGGTSEIVTARVTVADRAPTAAFTWSPGTQDEGSPVVFTDASTSAPDDITSWSWRFGDIHTSDDQNPQYIFRNSGLYTVRLTVTDDDGSTDWVEHRITIANVAPTVNANADRAAEEGTPVSFSGSFTDPGTDSHTIKWDFGDGSSQTGNQTPSHTYADNGNYTAAMSVTDADGGLGTDSLTVTVANVAPVITDLTNDNPSSGEVHLTVFFADPGWLDSHTSQWDFGDGSATEIDGDEDNKNPSVTGSLAAVHHYAAEGLFTVSVTVTDDDGAVSEPGTIDVLIDKTAPVITVYEPQAGFYRNTDEIWVDVAVADPESGGVSSGLVPESVEIFLDGRPIAADALLDLSELADGVHTLYVAASDHAGNSAEQVVSFDVGPVPALVHIDPHRWDLKWQDPFDIQHGRHSKDTIKAEISLENAEVETVIPTDKAAGLKAGDGYGDFVVVDIVAAQTGVKPGKEKIASLTLKYVGIDEMDILAFSGSTVLDFYSVNADDLIVIDGGQAGYLDRHTVLSSYQSDPPLLSAADIIPDTILLNQWIPIIEGSARLMTKDAADLAQSGVVAEPPYGIVKEKKHHVWLANVGQPREMTLEVGDQTIFADEPYPVDWQDWFSLDDDGRLQMMRIHASEKDNLLKVLHHNLQAEARIYLDGDLALTILPETNLVAMEVLFNRFDVMSTLGRDDLERGGDWQVTLHNGAKLKGKHPHKHIRISGIGHPQKARLMIGETVVFDDQSFPIKWSERYLVVGGERQDLSIKTHGARGKNPQLSINCKKLTHEVRLYLDDMLVLLISPPPEVGVSITGELELDGDPATFDGSFLGADQVELKGRLPRDYIPGHTYQRLNTSGDPPLQFGDRIGEFEVVDMTEGYHGYRVTDIEFIYFGRRAAKIKVYEDSGRKYLVESHLVSPGDNFLVDVHHLDGERVYLEIGRKHKTIHLTDKKAVAVGDVFRDCAVFNVFTEPQGPPYYVDLTLEYTGSKDLVELTAYDGKRQDVVGTYEINSNINPVVTIDGRQLPKGHIGETLVLEYGTVE